MALIRSGIKSGASYTTNAPLQAIPANTATTLTGVKAGDLVIVTHSAGASTTTFITNMVGLTSLGFSQVSADDTNNTCEVCLCTADNPSITTRLAVATFKVS